MCAYIRLKTVIFVGVNIRLKAIVPKSFQGVLEEMGDRVLQEAQAQWECLAPWALGGTKVMWGHLDHKVNKGT